MITLKEQIEYAEGWAQYSEEDKAILATLRRVEAVQVPVEPEGAEAMRKMASTRELMRHYDALRAQLLKVKGGE